MYRAIPDSQVRRSQDPSALNLDTSLAREGFSAAAASPEEWVPVAAAEPVKEATESASVAEPARVVRVPEADSEPAAEE